MFAARRFPLLTSIVAVAVLATASVQAAEPRKGGTLSISIESDLSTLDPLNTLSSFNDREAGILVYDTLLDMDSKGRIVPHLAEKMEAAPDATWFRLTLRDGVKFHDGTPLNADAVIKHYQRMMDPKNRCRCLVDLNNIASIDADGPLTIDRKSVV